MQLLYVLHRFKGVTSVWNAECMQFLYVLQRVGGERVGSAGGRRAGGKRAGGRRRRDGMILKREPTH